MPLSLNCCVLTLTTVTKTSIETVGALFSLCKVSNAPENYTSNLVKEENNNDSSLLGQRTNQPPRLIEHNKKESVMTQGISELAQTTQPILIEKESELPPINEDKETALTEDEIEAIIFYCGDNYYELNAGFVDKQSMPFYAKKHGDLKTAITKLTHNKLIKTFRGDHGNYFDNLCAGSLWQPNKFLSTSKEARKAYSYANGRCFIVAFGQTAADISTISWMPEEQEVLYNKGTQFRILFKHEYSEISSSAVYKNVLKQKNIIPKRYQVIEEAGLPDNTGQIKGLINALSLALPKRRDFVTSFK